MTIQNTTLRKAGPSQGNGVTTVFPFTFKVFTTADILVTYLDASSVESVLVLTTNYTVSLNADQNTSPGGSVTLLVAPVTGTYITLTSQVTNTQTLALTNSGGFYPESINNALDRTVIQVQQLAEAVSRCISVAVSSAQTGAQLLASIYASATSASSSASSASASATSASSSASSASASATSASSSASSAAGYVVPSQTSNAGKFLKTDGATVSWQPAASGGANSDITSLTGLTTALSVLQGGTGVTTSTGTGSNVLSASPTFTGNTTAPFVRGEFRKDAPSSVAFIATAAFAVSTATQMYIDINGTCYTFASGTVSVMPAAVAGTDYAIYACTDGTIRSDSNFSAPSGYTTTNSRKIGGFHYAPGGNATAQAGGNTIPYINAYSFWDLKFKPACQDPRGMTLVAGNFWADIYLLNTDPDTNGTSKYNVTIADGASPPKIPTKFGGNGTTAYTTLTWWEANEVLAANGKRSPSYQEYAALAFGTTEASAIGTDQVSTILNAVYTSKWGVMQATGIMDVWGKDFGGGAGTAAWTANTTGRGSTYMLCNAVLFGGSWSDGVRAGSRCSLWNYSPTLSGIDLGSRGVTDHLLLD